jgi:hypothetical protein
MPWLGDTTRNVRWYISKILINATLLEFHSLPTAKGPKTGGKGFADCFTRGSRQRTRGKEFIGKETFATCQEESSRQRERTPL